MGTFAGLVRQPTSRRSVTIGLVDDLEAIKQVKARYFRTMDTKEWAEMRTLFADDAVIDTTASGGEVIAGADEFLAFLRKTLADVRTVHHGHTPEITLTSPSTATGVWALQDLLIWPDGNRMHGYGHYHDAYTKVGASWLIKASTLTRLHMDFASG
jgi:hypothetical protein